MISYAKLDISSVEKAYSLFVECFGEKNNEVAKRDLLFSLSESVYAPHTHLALKDDMIIGGVQLTYAHLMPNTYTLSWLCVTPNERHKGVGSDLLLHSIQYAEKVIFQGNKGTICLSSVIKPEYYEKFGFIKGPVNHFSAPIMVKVCN